MQNWLRLFSRFNHPSKQSLPGTPITHPSKQGLPGTPIIIGLVLLGCGLAVAQQSPPDTSAANTSASNPNAAKPNAAQPKLPVHKEEMVVTGTYEPVAVSDADRDVTLLEVRDQRALYPSLMDVLRLDPAVDLQERGPNGVQTDLSIRGSSFAQNLVLVDGLRDERRPDRPSRPRFADAVPVDRPH